MPRDGTATRLRIMDAAQTLVIARGFSATTVDGAHAKLWSAIDWAYTEIRSIQDAARRGRLSFSLGSGLF